MFWDKVAPFYDIFANIINKKTHKELKKQISELVKSDDDILECACGTGMLTLVMAEKCQSIVATDFSKKMLKKTQKKVKKYKNVTVSYADINKIEYLDKLFDKVVAANVIHLLENPIIAIKELNRVCKDDGYIIIPTYMNKNNKKGDSFIKNVNKAGVSFKRQFSYESYQEFFKELGFVDAKYSNIEGKIPCAIAVLKKNKNLL